jgi:DNA-binding transcriptional ArsR family regulator
MPHPLPEPLAEIIAERFRVISEPMRIRILDRLRGGGATVGRLAGELGTSQQNVSKHLSVLARAGIVSREKHGTSVRCTIADESVFDLCERVCGDLSDQLDELRALLDGQEVTS